MTLVTLITFILIFQFWYFMSIIYFHRHLAHRSVRLSTPVVVLIKTMRWLVAAKGYSIHYDRRWAATHTKHHNNSDQEDCDPYMINVVKSPWAGIMGVTDKEMWELTKNNDHIKVTKLDHFYSRHAHIGYTITVAGSVLIWGWAGIILALALPLTIGPLSNAFNFIAHRWPGTVNVKNDPGIQSRNVLYVLPVYLGEEIHGNHHKWPGRANFGVRWWEIDVAYWFVKLLSVFKLAEILGDTRPPSGLDEKPTLVGYGKIKD